MKQGPATRAANHAIARMYAKAHKEGFCVPVRDRKNGGYRIKYPDGSLSSEHYMYLVGAEESCPLLSDRFSNP